MKTLSIILTFMYVLCVSHVSNALAQPAQDATTPVETSLSEAIKSFETKVQHKVKLPPKLPFMTTQSTGTILEQHRPKATLEIVYFNDLTKEVCKIYVTPASAPLKAYKKDQRFQLNDGSEALYRVKDRGFHQLEFQTNGLEYWIWIGTNSKENISPSVLVDMANSIL